MSSENPFGADNQQETRKGILRDHTPAISLEMKIWSDPHGDMRRLTEMINPPVEAFVPSI